MDKKHIEQNRSGAKRHAMWLAAFAFGVYAIYIVYVYVFTHAN